MVRILEGVVKIIHLEVVKIIHLKSDQDHPVITFAQRGGAAHGEDGCQWVKQRKDYRRESKLCWQLVGVGVTLPVKVSPTI